jgi:serine/threonine-protein kinase
MIAPKPSFFAELQRRHVYKVGAAYAVAGWLLVQIVTQVFPIFDVSALVQRIIVLVIVAGFPVTLILAWLFDVTPDGIVRTEALPESGETPSAQHDRHGTDRKLNYVLGTLLVIGVGYFIAEHSVLRDKSQGNAEPATASSGDKSIAVLPFANSTGDSANEYFSDGVSEELISTLSRLSHLKVIGRTSSFQFKGKADDSKTIGEKLGVLYLLEGSVRKSSDRVRIAVALVKSADGTNLWSQTYDRDFKDIFAVQSEIAGAVASQLQIALLGNNAQAAAAPGTDAPASRNAEAYKALLQGNFHFARQTVADYRQAIDYYKAALKLDPDYALAYANLAFSEVAFVTRFPASETGPVEALIAEARASVDTALRLQPNLARAHAVRGYILSTLDFRFVEGDAEVQRAVDLEPQNPQSLTALAGSKQTIGEFDASIVLARQTLSLDPLKDSAYYYLSVALMTQGHYDEAEAASRQAVELQPQSNFRRVQLVTVQTLRGNREAIASAQGVPDEFWRNYALGFAQAVVGDPALADAALKQLVDCCADNGAMQIASVYAARKDADKTFEWLDRALATRDYGISELYSDPFIRTFRSDPRFAAFATKAGLPALPSTTAGR